MSSESDHDYSLVVMLNESESTEEKLTFTLQKIDHSQIDPDQTSVAIIENEGIQAKIALPANILGNLGDNDEVTNEYLQNIVLKGLASVTNSLSSQSTAECIDMLEDGSNEINIILDQTGNSNAEVEQEKNEDGGIDNEDVCDNDDEVDENNIITNTANKCAEVGPNGNICDFQDLSVIQAMLGNLKEKTFEGASQSQLTVNIDGKTIPIRMNLAGSEESESELADMLEHDQKYTKLYKCGLCDMTYTTKYSLNIHIRHHTGEKPFKCSECNASFVRRSYLKYHMQNHTGVKLYQCSMCSMSYTSGSSLKNHMRTHTGEKPYKCDECDEAFPRKAYLNHHQVVAHLCEMPYQCDQCDKVYKTKSSLRMHQKTHIQPDQDHPNKCPHCSKTFTRQHDLKRHVLAVHDKTSYKCEICGLSYTAKVSLHAHMRVHTGEKPYSCDVCDAKFVRSSHLKTHKLSHDEKKPLTCDVCGVGFTALSSLNQHKIRHKGVKPYSCDLCSAKFFRQRSAVEHRRVHTGEKPYQCHACNQKFTWRCDLRRHKTQCELIDKLKKCKVCSLYFESELLLQQHVEEKHQFMCNKCFTSFLDENKLENHVSVCAIKSECVSPLSTADEGKGDVDCEIVVTYTSDDNLELHMEPISNVLNVLKSDSPSEQVGSAGNQHNEIQFKNEEDKKKLAIISRGTTE